MLGFQANRMFALLGLLLPAQVQAQIVTDGTMGPQVDFGTLDATIGEEIGQRRGANLFHSFSRFDISQGTTATFTGPDGIDNMIARITGGEASLLDGTLRSTIPGADVFFANPAGVLFGPNVLIDVPAGLHITTADTIRFADGTAFNTNTGSDVTLSVAAPESFGFLGGTAGIIGSFGASFGAFPGSRFSLSGGGISIDGGSGSDRRFVGSLSGQALLSSVGGPALVDLATGKVEGPGGTILISGNAGVIVTGNGSGQVKIDTGSLFVDGSSRISAGSDGTTNAAGAIQIEADDISVLGGSIIANNALVAGAVPGNVNISTSNLTLSGASQINAEGSFGAAAGQIIIQAQDLAVGAGGIISANTLAGGNAGKIDIQAGRFDLSAEGTQAFTGLLATASGDETSGGAAGSILIRADELNVGPDTVIAASNGVGGSGGQVDIEASQVVIDGTGSQLLTTVNANASAGSSDAGSVRIAADNLELLGGASVQANASGDGATGNVRIEGGVIRLSGDPELTAGTDISASSSIGGTNSPGSVSIVAQSLEIQGAALVQTNSFGSGPAGQIDIDVDDLSIRGFGPGSLSGILSQGVVPGAAGAGIVTINARNSLILSNGASIGSDTASLGAAGGVSIVAGRMEVLEQSTVGASSLLDQGGAAGDVVIRARSLLVEDGFISTFGAGAAGGRIDIAAQDEVSLRGGNVLSTGILPIGNASIISIEAPTIILNRSNVFSTIDSNTISPQFSSDAGVASLLGGQTVISADSRVLATNVLRITGLDAELGNDLALQQPVLAAPERLLATACANVRPATASSFSNDTSLIGIGPTDNLNSFATNDSGHAKDCTN